MNLFYYFGFFGLLQVVFGVPTSVTTLQFAFMFLRSLNELVRKVCVFLEEFSGAFILLELEMISFLPIIFRLLFRGAGFTHYLKSFFPFVKSENKGQ